MLILNQQEISNLLAPDEVVKTIETAFGILHEKSFNMPNRMHVHNKDISLLLMPCFINKHFGTKLVSVNPKNTNLGKPSIYGTMLLNDGITGEPLALLNGAALTAVRTGAVGGVGVKYISPENSSKLGIIGTGIQGFSQIIFAATVRPITDIYVFDLDSEKVKAFVKNLKNQLPDICILSVKNSEELVLKSDIIITTTSSKNPVIPNKKDLLRGKTFIGIGSYQPNMREYPDALFSLIDKVWVDTDFACKESGDIAIPLEKKLLQANQIHSLSDLILSGTKDQNTTSFFKSVGMALFDIVVAEYMYKKAINNKIGTHIEI